MLDSSTIARYSHECQACEKCVERRGGASKCMLVRYKARSAHELFDERTGASERANWATRRQIRPVGTRESAAVLTVVPGCGEGKRARLCDDAGEGFAAGRLFVDGGRERRPARLRGLAVCSGAHGRAADEGEEGRECVHVVGGGGGRGGVVRRGRGVGRGARGRGACGRARDVERSKQASSFLYVFGIPVDRARRWWRQLGRTVAWQ